MKGTVLSFLVAVIITCVLSCKKTVTITEYRPVVHSWLLDSSLEGEQKIILSSARIDDTTLAIANKRQVTFINANHLNGSINGAYLPGSIYGPYVGPSMTNDLIAFPRDSGTFFIANIKNSTSNIGSLSYLPDYRNLTNIALKGIPQPVYGQGYSMISNRYVLLPIASDNFNNVAKASLLIVDSITGLANSLQLTSVKDITLQPPSGPPNGFSYYNYVGFTFFQKFFLTLNYQFFRIDTLGNVKGFGATPAGVSNSSVFQMFTLGGYLWAVTNTSICVSQDQGESWSVFSTLSPGLNLSFLTYQNLGENLYAYYHSQLWKVALSGSTLNLTELDNDGLQTNQITGITKVGKYAFVSTLSGLFYRDTTSLNTPKK